LARRSNLPLFLGVVALLVGSALVMLVLRDDGETGTSPSGRAGDTEATVYVAVKKLTAGASGSDLLRDKAVEARKIPTTEQAVDAITAAVQLEGRLLGQDVEVGSQLRESMLRPATVRRDSVDIPEGMQAVAVQVPFVPGVAGYVGVDDRVNVYGVLKASPQGAAVKLVLSNVQVLDVSTEVAPRRAAADATAERSGASAITYLLALNPVDAAKIVYLSEYESMYLTLVPEGQPPAVAPPVVITDLLK
jgi:Flp pilus assembly protein CpaB